MNNLLSFREVQLGAYEVLKSLAKLCDERGWRYFLTYGSLIGAIRNKGIIPWDDDIDIMMPRPDYEKLKQYFQNHEKELLPLKLFDYSMVDTYPHMISRVSDMRYHLIFDNEKDYGIGLFVDIYPLDGVGNNVDEANKLIDQTKKTASLCFLTSRKHFATDNTASTAKMILKFPAYFWAKIRGNHHYIGKLEDASKLHSYEESKYVACLVWPAGKKNGKYRDVFDKELFETIKVPFEDSEFNIPIGYDKFLSVTYGDYMTPPDEAGRKTHHTYNAHKREV